MAGNPDPYALSAVGVSFLLLDLRLLRWVSKVAGDDQIHTNDHLLLPSGLVVPGCCLYGSVSAHRALAVTVAVAVSAAVAAALTGLIVGP
jgi:hypothetical protein